MVNFRFNNIFCISKYVCMIYHFSAWRWTFTKDMGKLYYNQNTTKQHSTSRVCNSLGALYAYGKSIKLKKWRGRWTKHLTAIRDLTVRSCGVYIAVQLAIFQIANHTSYNETVFHYNDVTMGSMPSQITSLIIVYSAVYSGADKKNIKAPRHWTLCGEFTGHRWISRTNGQ